MLSISLGNFPSFSSSSVECSGGSSGGQLSELKRGGIRGIHMAGMTW